MEVGGCDFTLSIKVPFANELASDDEELFAPEEAEAPTSPITAAITRLDAKEGVLKWGMEMMEKKSLEWGCTGRV